MIAVDEAALECDLAETYHIYEYRALTPSKVALFSIGLRDDSRIKLKLSKQQYSLELLLLAAAVDRLSILVWSKTKDGEKNKNRPTSVLANLLGKEHEKEIEVFESPNDFERAMREIEEKGEE